MRISSKGSTFLSIDRATAGLAVLGLASALLFWAAFVRLYSLDALLPRPGLSISKLSRDPRTGLLYFGAFAALFELYLLGALAAARARGRAAWVIVAAGAVLSSLLLLRLYPIDATDIFDYIMFGRVVAVHGANPFYTPPAHFPNDPVLPYAGWSGSTTGYGPLWTLLSAAMSRLALQLGDSLLVQVLIYKLSAVAAAATTALLIAAILRREAPERALLGVYLWSWNPLQLFVTAGNGHNDSVMVAPMLLSLWLVGRRRWSAAVLAALAGALVKFIPVLLVPLLGIVALRQLQGRARWRFIVTTAAGAGVLIGAAFAPFWRGGDMLILSSRAHLFTTSLPAWLWSLSDPRWNNNQVQAMLLRAALFTLAVAELLALWLVWRRPTLLGLAQAATALLLFYLLAAIAWFQPWYAIWPLALAALLPDGPLRPVSLLLTFAVTWKAPLFEYVLAPPGKPLPTARWWEGRLFPIILGPVWLVWILDLASWMAARLPPAGRRAGPGAGAVPRRWPLHGRVR
ncbi:MAG: hypothetical protein M5U01_40390 [Ardenticatenaceae bacterium]|nr:hypothetical protein [Ardenticatenaceae bacterium]